MSFGLTNQSLKSLSQIGVFVQWRVGERASTPCIPPTVKHRGGSVIV